MQKKSAFFWPTDFNFIQIFMAFSAILIKL